MWSVPQSRMSASTTVIKSLEPLSVWQRHLDFPTSPITLHWIRFLQICQVLLSLNMTQWGCHFTTTANITSCQAEVVAWNTYIKQANTTDQYIHKLGFLAAGKGVFYSRTNRLSELLQCSAAIDLNLALAHTFNINTGDDVKPAQNISFEGCKRFCSDSTICHGFTFQVWRVCMCVWGWV